LQFDREGKPLAHGEDTGRAEITHNSDHAYKFRSLTLRQLKDARTFFHNGSFSKIRDVVSYFNDGVPQDQEGAERNNPPACEITLLSGQGTP
jgi:cytochrome c peroxidase